MASRNGSLVVMGLQRFIKIISDNTIQKGLDGLVRDEEVYKEISQWTLVVEFQRTTQNSVEPPTKTEEAVQKSKR